MAVGWGWHFFIYVQCRQTKEYQNGGGFYDVWKNVDLIWKSVAQCGYKKCSEDVLSDRNEKKVQASENTVE